MTAFTLSEPKEFPRRLLGTNPCGHCPPLWTPAVTSDRSSECDFWGLKGKSPEETILLLSDLGKHYTDNSNFEVLRKVVMGKMINNFVLSLGESSR